MRKKIDIFHMIESVDIKLGDCASDMQPPRSLVLRIKQSFSSTTFFFNRRSFLGERNLCGI